MESNSTELIITPTPKQLLLITAPVEEVFFGGARGGGKTEGMLMTILKHMLDYGPRAKCLFLRASYPELEDVIKRVREHYARAGRWNTVPKELHVNGGFCRFRYLDSLEDADNYQGHEYTLIAADEAANFRSFDALMRLKACLRSPDGVPCRMIVSANPKGRQHNRIKQRYITGHEPLIPFHGDDGSDRVYIPSKLSDNPFLLQNDPTYERRLASVGNPALVKAWLEGDWSDDTAGGCIDDIYTELVHVLPPFAIPKEWIISRSFDHGVSKPSACLWTAEATTDHYTTPQGETRYCLKGDLFIVDELYTCTGEPDTGTRESVQTIANKIKAIDGRWGKITHAIADSAIFTKMGSLSVGDEFAKEGVTWSPCKKGPGSRQAGLEAARGRFIGSLTREAPGLFLFDSCRHCRRTFPLLQRDPVTPETPDTTGEDHLWDAMVYRLALGNASKHTITSKPWR